MGGRRLEKAELESILEESRIARICCHNEDGTIHATPVWYKYMNGKIVFVTVDRSIKARNLKRNKNVTVLIDLVEPAVKGVMIYGTAELDYSDIFPVTLTICEKYLEKEKAKSFAEMMVESATDLIVRIKPERMITFHF
jgi:nitroimidazol reductase NimA-like FMN-containing flavoprotein (pyridoxamine 5'-phosphate oxidase superfamily)